MSKGTVLVTWGLGYIGSHSAVALEQAGYKTVIIDNLGNSSIEVLDQMADILGYRPTCYVGDVGDESLLQRIFESHDITAVAHFAALKSVGESCKEPLAYYENNISKSVVLFDAMKRFRVSKFVFSSSASVYHPENPSPISEDGVIGGAHPYAGTKIVAERILQDLARYEGFSVIAFRYFNPIGAHPSGKMGEKPADPPANLFPYVLDVAAWERPKVLVYWNDYPTRDGTGIRDYIDINDLADAHVIACDRLHGEWAEANDFRVYNLGTRLGTTVLELISAVERITGHKVPYEIVGRRMGDPAELYASYEKAKNELGWSPKNAIDDSVRTGWLYRKQRMVSISK